MKHHPEPLTNKTAIAILDSFGVWKHDWTQVGGRLDQIDRRAAAALSGEDPGVAWDEIRKRIEGGHELA